MVRAIINGEVKSYEEGTTFETIVNEYQEQYDHTIALVIANGKIHELHKKLKRDAEISFITTSDTIGNKTYERSAIMLLLKAAYDILGLQGKMKVEFAIDKGIYCEFG